MTAAPDIAAILANRAGLPPIRVSKLVAVGLDIAAWGVVHASTGYLVYRLPLRCFGADTWFWRSRGWERDGWTYTRVLRIRRWQRHLPEGGALFAGGFDKGHLHGRSTPLFERYMAEARRAELGHVLAILPAPLFALWNPPWVVPIMVTYALIANAPCVLSMRYNRLRLARVLARRAARVQGGRG